MAGTGASPRRPTLIRLLCLLCVGLQAAPCRAQSEEQISFLGEKWSMCQLWYYFSLSLVKNNFGRYLVSLADVKLDSFMGGRGKGRQNYYPYRHVCKFVGTDAELICTLQFPGQPGQTSELCTSLSCMQHCI